MPIVENDPWRMQYFEGVACPEDVVIPTDDPDCWALYPDHHWIYNKLLVCRTQGLESAPHGIAPRRFPVFSKPMVNLRGMGAGGKVLHSRAEYEREQTPGHMWMPLLDGEHVSSDVALLDGEPLWWRHTVGKPLAGGTFDWWTVLAEPRPAIENYCGEWFRRNLRGYRGIANVETIGGRIIECHLRMADQWVDLNGAGWVESVVGLYRDGSWSFRDEGRRDGWSVVLFGEHGPRYHHVDPSVVADLRQRPEVSSIQITFHEDKAPELHAMPPGGFRLAIVNAWSLDAGLEVRAELSARFGCAEPLRAAG